MRCRCEDSHQMTGAQLDAIELCACHRTVKDRLASWELAGCSVCVQKSCAPLSKVWSSVMCMMWVIGWRYIIEFFGSWRDVVVLAHTDSREKNLSALYLPCASTGSMITTLHGCWRRVRRDYSSLLIDIDTWYAPLATQERILLVRCCLVSDGEKHIWRYN